MAQDRSLPPLTALQAFHAAGLAGSFAEAARALSVTPSAISHQIKSLEAWMGVPLFRRGVRQVTLTAEGRALLKETDAALSRIRNSAARLRGRREGAVLRISALPLFTNAWLIPRLERFERRHPGIGLAIDTTNRIVDLEREHVDIAIRNLRRPTPGVIVKKLLDIRPLPLCTPKLAEQLKSPADLTRHTLIHNSARGDAWARWLKAAGYGGLKAKSSLTFDTMPAALEAAARGRGVVMGMDPIVWEAAEARPLVTPFRERVPGDSSYYVAYRKSDGVRAEVSAFVTWLEREMAEFKKGAKV
jgi:LysR family glycine cleavage system transcriptional activator